MSYIGRGVDTDDKTAIDEKRAEIKLKYPKPGA
jgi:hypothetical protein